VSERGPDWRVAPGWPDVDVVMPVRNESAHLAAAVASVREQAYPGRLRIFLAVAPSTDGTEAVVEALGAADDITVVANPASVTPSGLNEAIRAGASPVVVRVDGHSRLSDSYIVRAVETLRRTGAANVGGRQVPEPATPFEEAVAAATSSWLGTGGATYRTGGEAGPVDTVYLGVFDRASIEAVGLFDERLIRNQDYELNIRLRAAGGTVWFDPELAVGYRPRGSWRALARQYYEYGYWKAHVLRMHPSSLRLRQLAPPLGIIATAVGLVAAARVRRLAALPAGYLLLLLGGSQRERRHVNAALTACIHSAWTVGQLVGWLDLLSHPTKPARRPEDVPAGSGATPRAN
jgi:glycosyltransferase involved in cell wall biosynthesis